MFKELILGAKKSYCSSTFKARDVILFLTYRCTSRCKACNIWLRPNNKNDELSWEEWRGVLDRLAAYGIKSIELFGGDALLRKDVLIEMVRYCSKKGIETFFPTNSSLLTDEIASELVEAGLGTIYFSFDELSEIKGSIRGIDNHCENVINAINTFKKYRNQSKKPEIVCITTVSKLNYKLLCKILVQVDRLGIDVHVLRGISEFTVPAVKQSSINGIYPEPYFMPTDNISKLYSNEEAIELIDMLRKIKKRKTGTYVDMKNMESLNIDHLKAGTYPFHPCLFSTTQMVLTPTGDVLPCLYFNKYILGNLKNQEVSEVWGNKMHREFCSQQKNNQISICDQCSIKFYHKNFTETASYMCRKLYRVIANS